MTMTRVQKIVLSPSRDIPFNKLVLSQSNVRRIKAGVSIEELAEDIARRTLLQSITVRPVRDADGVETGMFEVPAGGRRFRALELLVKQKRLAKTAPVPCVVREDGIPEEDSLAENVQRAPLHPLDQFRAFLTLREKGQSEEEIAAAFFVAVSVVKQRLRLASVSPRLLDVYADDGMTLDQLMAFTVNGDHARQEQVFERLSQSYSKEPHVIRRMLTEGAVRASDKRALFVGLDAYTEAGGVILRDLFQGDDGGWLQDVGLLDRLVAEKLGEQSEAIRAEGWKWVEVAPDFAYGHTYGLRQLRGEQLPLTGEEQATRDALQAEMDGLEETYAEADELPDEVDQRLGEIETALGQLDDRPQVFDAQEVARAGAFVSIDSTGVLRVERGYVRPEDELPIASEADVETDPADEPTITARTEHDGTSVVAATEPSTDEPEEDDGIKPIPDRLMTELTAHRTLALRHALGEHPDIAFVAALHALCLKLFYRFAQDTCLELDVKSAGFGAQAPGLADSALAVAFDARHQAWLSALPKEPADLWDGLMSFDTDSHQALFAHCVSLSVNAIYEGYHRKHRALAHADRIAQAVDLDMVAAGWTPTLENYFGRVTKARILAAVREAKGARAGDRIEHLKKAEMAAQAETLLAGSGWLPEPLRTPGRSLPNAFEPNAIDPVEAGTDAAVGETAAGGGETAMVEDEEVTEDESVALDPHATAAE
jgi:ParB family chromosome partitioning protein